MEPFLFISFIIVLLALFFVHKKNHRKRAEEVRIENIAAEKASLEEFCIELTPQELFKLRKDLKTQPKHSSYRDGFNFAGIYILHNLTKNKYYVGQSVNVMNRVNTHFKGRTAGNKGVYKDFKHGDEWNIKMVRLEDTRFLNLNDMEKYAIQLYEGYTKGYNKTRGNKS